MSRYSALADYLERLDQPSWEASFEQVERLIGSPLPKSAYRYPAWWANQTGPGHSQTRGWRNAGWRTCNVDLARRRVRFERASAKGTSKKPEAANDDQLMAEARRWSGIEDRSALIREALRALIAREAAQRLARLGGSMPEFSPPDRERPA